MDDHQLDTLRRMIREAQPGSVLAVAPDVFDRHGADLAEVVGGMVGHSMTISRSPAMKPGMVAVISQHAGTPISGGAFGKYIGAYSMPKPVLEEAGVEIEAVAPKPPKPPKPNPPASPKPVLPPHPGPQKPRGPRQRIVDT
jgi:hypothetical protein